MSLITNFINNHNDNNLNLNLACFESLCQNGGVCSYSGNNYKCSCVGVFFGKNCENKIWNLNSFKNSTILTYELSLNLIKLIGLNKTNYQLLYQAGRDGFDNKIFHSKCDAFSGILILIKTKNLNIFGGFTSADWFGDYQNKFDSTAFLYSLVNSYNVSVKMNVIKPDYAIYSSPSYGIAFGYQWNLDLYCDYDQCGSNLGYSYESPSFMTSSSIEANTFLGGTKYFQAVEIEVYWIDRKNIFCHL